MSRFLYFRFVGGPLHNRFRLIDRERWVCEITYTPPSPIVQELAIVKIEPSEFTRHVYERRRFGQHGASEFVLVGISDDDLVWMGGNGAMHAGNWMMQRKRWRTKK